MRVFVTAVLLCLFLEPGFCRAYAQSVLVQVTESESGRPITGAFVSLFDHRGKVLRSALTNEQGRFLFRAPNSGSFHLRAEMIGRETRFSTPITLGPTDSGRIDLSLPIHAIPLAELLVEADERCRLRPDEASRIYRVWEEARKALTVQAWTEQEGTYLFEIMGYERDLDPKGEKVDREQLRKVNAVTSTPIRSVPVEDLVTHGFVRPLEDGGHEYFGPDAEVILSDHFLDTHCLRLARSRDNPGSIGIAFEPVEDNGVPDIKGTLWLDEMSASLAFLEFGYLWAPQEEGKGIAEGRVEFKALPNGAWIVNRWWIRAPMMALDSTLVRRRRPRIFVAGIRETGGVVSRVSTLKQEISSELGGGSLTGVVWDSTAPGPLVGATVYLSGTEYFEETDSLGRFLMEGLPGGVFSAGFLHPRLGTLGITLREEEVEITPGDLSEIHLGIPSPGAILLATCRAEEREDGGSVLAGVVRDWRTGEVIPGVSVRIQWQETSPATPDPGPRKRWFEVSTNGEGRYTACGIPLDEAITVQASFLEIRSDTAHLRIIEEEYRVLDLHLDLPPGLLSTRTEALILKEGMGVQGVQGVLLDPQSGNPIRSAEVSLRQSPGSVVLTGETDARGFFRLQTPVPGRYLLSARVLGYAEVTDEALDVQMGKLAVLEIRMAPEALELPPLLIAAEPRAFHLEMQGFYERQARGLDTGIFLSPEFLQERDPHKLTDLFFELPGTRVVETAVGGRGVYFRSGERFGDTCWPMVFLDRHLIRAGGFMSSGADPAAIDDLVPASDVAAVEVYRSPAEVPAEFNGPNAGCGVVVLWTRRGGGT